MRGQIFAPGGAKFGPGGGPSGPHFRGSKWVRKWSKCRFLGVKNQNLSKFLASRQKIRWSMSYHSINRFIEFMMIIIGINRFISIMDWIYSL
jgi:hypothetical protein